MYTWPGPWTLTPSFSCKTTPHHRNTHTHTNTKIQGKSLNPKPKEKQTASHHITLACCMLPHIIRWYMACCKGLKNPAWAEVGWSPYQIPSFHLPQSSMQRLPHAPKQYNTLLHTCFPKKLCFYKSNKYEKCSFALQLQEVGQETLIATVVVIDH